MSQCQRSPERSYFMGSVRLRKCLLLGSCFGGTLLGCSAKDPAATDENTQGSTSMGGSTTSNGLTSTATSAGFGPTTATTSNGTTGTSGTSVGPGPTTTTTGFGPVTSSGAGGGASSVTGGTPSTTGSSGDCGITVDTYDISSAISTVGIVTWSAASTPTSATIEFGLTETGPTMSAPVDLAEPGYKTLLLGMKGEREYSFHIVADAGGQTCTSETYTLTTGPVPTNIPLLDRPQQPTAEATKTGFI